MVFKYSIKLYCFILLLLVSQFSCSKKYTKLEELDNKTNKIFNEVPINNNLKEFYNDNSFKYKIGIGDKVSVFIYNDYKDSTQEPEKGNAIGVEVDNNGEINIPLVKNVKIVGNIHIKSEDKKFIENEIIR